MPKNTGETGTMDRENNGPGVFGGGRFSLNFCNSVGEEGGSFAGTRLFQSGSVHTGFAWAGQDLPRE
jgi:hypothetical protein